MYTQYITYEFKDSVSVPGLSIPSTQVCELEWTPPYTLCKGGWSKCAKKGWCGWGDKKCCEWGWTNKCTWVKGEMGWCCCWTTPVVQLWPDLTFTYLINVPMNFIVTQGYLVGYDTPPEPFLCESYTIYTFSFNVNINNGKINETVTIDLGDEGITFYAYNDYFYAQEYLTSVSGEYKWEGITYNMAFDFYILYCLEPEAPMSWINLQVSASMTVYYEGITYDAIFSVACPIIPPPE
jgi:hypothetical protein